MTSAIVTRSFRLTRKVPDGPIDIMYLGLAMEVPDYQNPCLCFPKCMLGKELSQKPQYQVLSTKEIYFLQRQGKKTQM